MFVKPGFVVGLQGLYPLRRRIRWIERAEIPPFTRGETVLVIACVDSWRVVEFLERALITSSSTSGVHFLGLPTLGSSVTYTKRIFSSLEGS